MSVRTKTHGLDPAKVEITRHRFSVTQGEVSLSYAGTELGRFGDRVTHIGDDG